MRLRIFVATLIAVAIGFSPSVSNADVIILDMDPSTAPVMGFPPGPATGFESSITVTSGTTVTVVAYLVPSTPILFDSFAFDMYWGAPADTATAMAVPATSFAGATAGLGAPTIDLFSGGPTGPGVPLLAGPFPPMAPPFTMNLGGHGYFDAAMGLNFGGLGAGPAVGTLIDIMGQDFTVSGGYGDSVSLVIDGLFDPSIGMTAGLATPGRPLIPGGGDALYDQASGLTTPVMFIGGTIFVVPEPSAATFLLLCAVGFIYRRSK